MTILSAQSIRARGIFEPFAERAEAHGMTYGLGPAGYDVRVAETMRLAPGDFALASTIEHFAVPPDILGMVADKSTWARRGLAVQHTVIEPGWSGYLTLELTNHGHKPIDIVRGMPIAQIVLHMLDAPTEKPYSGRYQNQQSGPVPATYIVEHIIERQGDEYACSCSARWPFDEGDEHP